jgi:hypothetical protein
MLTKFAKRRDAPTKPNMLTRVRSLTTERVRTGKRAHSYQSHAALMTMSKTSPLPSRRLVLTSSSGM